MNHSVTRVLYEAVTLCQLSEESDFDNRTRTTVHDYENGRLMSGFCPLPLPVVTSSSLDDGQWN